MFDHNHYVPVLKGKRGEFAALEAVHEKSRITPLIEAVPSSASDSVPIALAGKWPSDVPYFIDMVFCDDDDADGDQHALSECFSAEQMGSPIPVTGTGRSPAYQEAVRQIVQDREAGMAVRLVSDDFDDADELAESLDALASLANLERGEIDVIIDADSVVAMGAASVGQMHLGNIALLPHLDEWRTLTVIASAFPTGLSGLTRDTWNVAPRLDWAGWLNLRRNSRRIGRLPTYGDYAIANPDLPPTGRATILAQLRYTCPDHWLIWKGHNVFTHSDGFGQFFDICEDLIERDEYRGPDFSEGDREIEEKATNRDSPGNAETWRRIGTNHHIETVLDQIANLS